MIGYNEGVRVLEIGGLLNFNTRMVRYFQVGGIGNVVGGKVEGLQVAGILNTVHDSVKGLQVGGILNSAKNIKGLQLAGVYNKSSKNVAGVQIARVVNIVENIKGLQISGLVNYTCKAKNALQIGVINIVSDSSDKLLPIGVLSFIKNGYKRWELGADELQNYSLSFKTGIPAFYNIVIVGSNLQASNTIITGYGLGTSFGVSERFFLELYLSLSQVLDSQKNAWFENALAKTGVATEYTISKHWSVVVSSSFNQWFSNTQENFFGFYKKIPSAKIFESTKNGSYTMGWIGFQGGVRWRW